MNTWYFVYGALDTNAAKHHRVNTECSSRRGEKKACDVYCYDICKYMFGTYISVFVRYVVGEL